MSRFFRYTETDRNLPDSFNKTITVGGKTILFEFIWPSYIEEELHNIDLAVYSRMTGQGLDDGTQIYDYFTYWTDVAVYLTTHTSEEWIADSTKAKPVILMQLPEEQRDAWIEEQLAFYIDCLDMYNFYNELLVWEVRITYRGYTLSNAVNLGGWTEFPDGTFAFRFASDTKERIGREDLPYLNIFFEVYDE